MEIILNNINDFFGIFVSYLAPILFFKIYGFPLIVLVLFDLGLPVHRQHSSMISVYAAANPLKL